MFAVFVSYAQKQVDWATHLRSVVNSPGITVHVAEQDLAPGNSLGTDIAQQIKACDLFIPLWTEAAQQSKYVAAELSLAKTEGKPIVPVLLQPGVSLPSELGDIKYLDITKDPTKQVQWLQSHVAERAKNKQVSTFVALGMVGFLAWAILKGNE